VVNAIERSLLKLCALRRRLERRGRESLGAELRTASFFHELYSLESSIPEEISATKGRNDEYLRHSMCISDAKGFSLTNVIVMAELKAASLETLTTKNSFCE
jgi:hypothetical protein